MMIDLKTGDVVITKISKSGIPIGTQGVIGHVDDTTSNPNYKFISDTENDYQAWFKSVELEKVDIDI